MKHKTIGTWFTVGGLLLIAAALCLVTMNFYEETRAAKAADAALAEILALSQAAESSQTEETTAPDAPITPPSGEFPDETPDSAETPTTEPTPNLPEYVKNPDMKMPVRTVQGQDYIGILDIPELQISLPVISDWSYPKLKIAPCRFQGSVYLDNLIILGHNYRRHLAALKDIEIGEKVSFTDMDGNIFRYKVSEIVILDGDDIESMVAEDGWDLTLFTCTMSGQTRITVRCAREMEEN